jgi:putative intracellular protease/amidase
VRFTALDAIGPYQVLTYLPGADGVICAEHTGSVGDHNDLVHLRVDSTFADVPRPDVLFVPGGPVTA